MKSTTFKSLSLAVGMVVGVMAASSASAVSIPQFQIDPTDSGVTPGVYGTQFTGSSSERYTMTGGNTLTTTFGYMDLGSLTNDGPMGTIGTVLPGISGIGVNYQLYFTYSLTAQLLTGTLGGFGSTYSVTALNFNLWYAPGLDTSFTPATLLADAAVNQGGTADYSIASGSLVSPGTAGITALGGAYVNATTDFILNAAGKNYFVDPVPFYNLAFTSQINNTGGVNVNAPYVAISASGNVSFQTVPEPATLALMGLGLVGMGVSLRKRKAA